MNAEAGVTRYEYDLVNFKDNQTYPDLIPFFMEGHVLNEIVQYAFEEPWQT